MSVFEALLAPLPGDNVSGTDLRNDARFHAIERLMAPAARVNRVRSGANGAAPAQVDWEEVLGAASDLAAEGRDLRLLVIAARALANTEGFAGLAKGLDLLRRSVEDYWDTIHPELRDRASPREAAVRRVNALYQTENADDGILGDLELTVFLAPRGLGPVTGDDLAAGRVSHNTVLSEAPSGLGEDERAALAAEHEARVNRVTAACRATHAERPEELAALAEGVAAARAALSALESALSARVGENGVGVRFTSLERFLARVADTLAAASADAPAEAAAAAGPIPAAGAPAAPAAPAPSGGGVPGQITSRREVERCLDMIIEFYDRTEPASPIPLIARRLRRMVPMTFLQLMEEVAPSGMKEFRNIAGVGEEKSR